jgi:IS30 family transposase
LLRNTTGGKAYGSHFAQQACQARRHAAKPETKLDVDGLTWLRVLTLLDWRWSPQQISGTLKRVFPNDPTHHVSHETIYSAIYAQPRGELRRQLIACLRRGHSTRMPRTRGVDRRGQIPDMLSIRVRPPEIEDRVMPGHWEGDLIKGAANQSSVGVLVERSSRLVLLAKMQDATAASALAGFSAKLNSIAKPMRHSLTYDQGKEMSRHAQLREQTGVNIYFCDPHSPWQRGTCENINGLLRQYMPKGTDLSVHTQDDLDAIADSLNNRPRATHEFNTPLAVFAAMLELAQRAPNQIN